MNVEIGTEAAPFPEKEYINGIFVAVRYIFKQKGPKISSTEWWWWGGGVELCACVQPEGGAAAEGQLYW
jgi:hypothetical protein